MSEETQKRKAELMILSGILSGINAENYVDKLLEFSRRIWETRVFGKWIVDGESQTLRIEELEIRWNPNNGSKLIQPHNIGIRVFCANDSGCYVRVSDFVISKAKTCRIPVRLKNTGGWYTYVPLSMLWWSDHAKIQEVVNSLQDRIDGMIKV